MSNTQVALIQIDNYGPWTVTPEPRREADLQTLQSRLYADLCQLIGDREGYVFYARGDNMIAVTNGLSIEDHARVQESVRNRYPVTVSLSVATGGTPVAALREASSQLQAAGSAQDGDRQEILRGETLREERRTDGDVQLAHFDVNDATGKYTDRLNEYDTFIRIEQGYAALMRYVRETHGALSFFVGGDNVITVCPNLDETAYRDVIAHVREAVGVDLKVGVGRARTAGTAGMDAKHALEECRHDGRGVVLAF
ncbi:GTP cyclohydrolase IIa [Halobacteriales archaeon QS_4_69_34]|nr:MAG: GTP cyclohydrolase IIa [Halobacteriales archaeon QS_4_69_34]